MQFFKIIIIKVLYEPVSMQTTIFLYSQINVGILTTIINLDLQYLTIQRHHENEELNVKLDRCCVLDDISKTFKNIAL